MATFLTYKNPDITFKLDDVACLRIPSHNTYSLEIYMKGFEMPFALNFPTEKMCKEQYEYIKKMMVAATASENFHYIYNYDRTRT